LLTTYTKEFIVCPSCIIQIEHGDTYYWDEEPDVDFEIKCKRCKKDLICNYHYEPKIWVHGHLDKLPCDAREIWVLSKIKNKHYYGIRDIGI
jgi:hypothetical protein